MFRTRKAQAATELVVLGTLIIVAFSYLINYSEKLNRQQSYIQQTFRAALKEARNANNSASYTKVVFRRMANVSTPMELGQLQSFSSSANVFWADGTNTADPISKYQLNEDNPIDAPAQEYSNGSGGTTTTPPAGTTETSNNRFINQVTSDVTLVKQNNTTTKTLSAKDILKADVTVSGSARSFTHSLGSGGKYYPGTDNSLDRSRSMQ